MSENAFLTHFINGPIYLIKEGVTSNYGKTDQGESQKAEEPLEEINIEKSKESVELTPLTTSGKNLKHCIILTDWAAEADAEEKQFLSKIMTSVKRIEDDVLVVHAQKATTEDVNAILAEHNHKHVIDFGTGKLDRLASAELYIHQLEGGKKLLKANKLSEISKNVELKKSLWNALQSVFLH